MEIFPVFHSFWEKIIKLLTYYLRCAGTLLYRVYNLFLACDNVYVYKVIT